jgi:hypothetical protein
LHLWSSLGLIGGVLMHLLLHWKWIGMMTGKVLGGGENARAGAVAAPGARMTRRQFLSLGLVALAAGALATLAASRQGGVGESLPGAGGLEQAKESESPEQPEGMGGSENLPAGREEQATPQPPGVACPRGFVNDPYPGHCRSYTDRNGDGICDYSVLGSGDNPARY